MACEARSNLTEVVCAVAPEGKSPGATVEQFDGDVSVATEVAAIVIEVVDHNKLAIGKLNKCATLRLRVAATVAGEVGVCEGVGLPAPET